MTPGSSVPCRPYSGDILDVTQTAATEEGEGEGEVPLWAEDQWSAQRVQEAEQRIEQQGAAVSAYWREK